MVFYVNGYHRVCNLLTHSFPTQRSSDLWNDRAGTRWKFSLIPLGGYVKMFGDANAASMPAEDAGGMSEAERAVAFPHKRLGQRAAIVAARSEEHTSELQSLMRISYAVFCLKKKNTQT